MSIFDEEQQKFMKLVEQMHLLGVSQRKIKMLAKTVFGIPISVDRVGTIYRELAQKEDININAKPLGDDYEYLLLDGIWEKTKGYGWDENKSVLLCGLGITTEGKRQIIGFALEREESTESWRRFISSLKKRGLKGTSLKLVIADDHAGLKAGVENRNILPYKYKPVLFTKCAELSDKHHTKTDLLLLLT